MAERAPRRSRAATRPARSGASFERFRDRLLSDTALSLVASEASDVRCELLQNGASALAVTVADGMILASYSGPVDLAFLMMGHAFAEGTGRWRAKAAVVDFTRALIAFDGEALEHARGCLTPTQMDRPRAIVAPRSHANMVKDFAMRAAFTHSAIQRGFIDRAQAVAWASQYARHMPAL